MRRNNSGFSLLEVTISMGIMLIVGLGVIAGIIYTRQSMELEKQRLAALNYARRTMEEAQNTINMLDSGQMTLVPFNAPGLEIAASVGVSYYRVNDDGSIDSAAMSAPPNDTLTMCRVTVLWTPTGSWSRQQKVSLQALVSGGLVL
jgi:type II secretory pathway pseudopilin PulG